MQFALLVILFVDSGGLPKLMKAVGKPVLEFGVGEVECCVQEPEEIPRAAFPLA